MAAKLGAVVFVGNVSFSEFTRDIVDTWSAGIELDKHWREQHKLCHPCHIKYDFIGRFEHYGDDARRVLAKLPKPAWSVFRLPVANPSHRRVPLSQQREKYYAKVSRDIVRNLIRIYKIDYELFGYDYRWACSSC